MSLLMPEYERNLRAAARRLASDSAATPKPSRNGFGSWLLVALAGAVTVGIAVAALALVGHRGAPNSGTPSGTLPAVQYSCAGQKILRTRGRLVPIAHGTVARRRWTLEADSGRRGFASVQAGRLLLGGHAYGFCRTGVDIELVNSGPHGIVYGIAPRRIHPPITIQASTARGTIANPVSAYNYPATSRHVPGGTLFLRTLPAPACAYRGGLAMSASEGSVTTSTGTSSTGLLVMVGHFTRSCAPGQLLLSAPDSPAPASLQPCRSSQLGLGVGPDVSEMMEQHTLILRIHNTSASACELRGYPRIVLRDKSGAALPFQYRQGGDLELTNAPPKLVTLSPGGNAYWGLNKNVCVGHDQGLAAEVSFAPPGSRSPLAIALRRYLFIDYCGQSDPGHRVDLTPIEPTLNAVQTQVMPEVVGDSVSAANSLLGAARIARGARVTTRTVRSPAPRGSVVGQVPAAGTTLGSRNEQIVLTVSRGRH